MRIRDGCGGLMVWQQHLFLSLVRSDIEYASSKRSLTQPKGLIPKDWSRAKHRRWHHSAISTVVIVNSSMVGVEGVSHILCRCKLLRRREISMVLRGMCQAVGILAAGNGLQDLVHRIKSCRLRGLSHLFPFQSIVELLRLLMLAGFITVCIGKL